MNPKLKLKKKNLYIIECLIIVLLACVPLFTTFPYRVNIFLSWEGAYRMSNGELPFRDFGIPLGGMYWVIPAIFFKIFGTQLITLVKAQVFINIISGLAFRSILKSCKVEPGIRMASVLLYCISYSFFNFWPWYNHTVIFYEFIALAFLLKGMALPGKKASVVCFVSAALFTVFSFLTKQDAGALAFILCIFLISYWCLRNRKWLPLLVYGGSVVIFFLLIIAPFLKFGFAYWFNHGQAPHSARISLTEIVTEFFSSSAWIKFYLFLILIILVIRFRSIKQLWESKKEMVLILLTMGILVEAAIFQVTSYTPPDNNIFFHSFAIACILTLLAGIVNVDVNKRTIIVIFSMGILLWWSNVYWKYIQRVIQRGGSQKEEIVSTTGENIVNRKTFTIRPADSAEIKMAESTWIFSGLKSFEGIYMPRSTVEGLSRLLKMDIIQGGKTKDLRVLNMSELTPLAVEIPYKLDKGPEYPLWYHLGVGMFNKQAELFERKIAGKDYDLVLFEYIPVLNNFYPFRVRDSLQVYYKKVDSFPAPRRGDTQGMIEVYVR